MSDKIETPVVEAAQSTVDKLWAQPKQEFKMPTPGEYMAAMHIGGDTFRKVQEACKAAAAKNQTALQAAAGDIVTTDTPGLLPVPVVSPLFQDLTLFVQLLQHLVRAQCRTHQAKHLFDQRSPRTPARQHNHQNLPQYRRQQWLSHRMLLQNRLLLDKSHCQFRTWISPIQQR
jgi:hypothetical protein